MEKNCFIVTSITTQCPHCGDEVTDKGQKAAESNFGAQIICRKCGFTGELPD